MGWTSFKKRRKEKNKELRKIKSISVYIIYIYTSHCAACEKIAKATQPAAALCRIDFHARPVMPGSPPSVGEKKGLCYGECVATERTCATEE